VKPVFHYFFEYFNRPHIFKVRCPVCIQIPSYMQCRSRKLETLALNGARCRPDLTKVHGVGHAPPNRILPFLLSAWAHIPFWYIGFKKGSWKSKDDRHIYKHEVVVICPWMKELDACVILHWNFVVIVRCKDPHMCCCLSEESFNLFTAKRFWHQFVLFSLERKRCRWPS